jgi:hypothetical protein
MDSDTQRTERPDQETEHQQGAADAYWRRRVYVLAGGIAVIGLVAWACSDSGDRRSTAQVRNAAATMSPPMAPASAGPVPTATVTVTATPTITPSSVRRDGDRCDDDTVVVGLRPTATVYPRPQHPRFGLSVVNTGRRTCTFDVGPKALQIRIASGSDHVWSSARCIRGAGSSVQLLQRGVPYLATIDWDRKRCDGEEHARPGTYVISIAAPGVKTRREVFRLR